MDSDKICYLCSPYSHPDPAVRQIRFQVACEATAHLMRQGMHVFSPIVHSHPLATIGGLPWGDHDFWRPNNKVFMSRCERFVVLMLPGWRESIGVQDEIRMRLGAGKDIEYMAWPPELDNHVARIPPADDPCEYRDRRESEGAGNALDAKRPSSHVT